MGKEKRLRAYFWKCHEDAEHGLAVVAETAKRAKDLGYSYWAADVGTEPETWIEQRIKWTRNANIKGITKEGVIEELDGLRRNIYGWVEDMLCDNCGNTDMLYHSKGKALCNGCIEHT